MDYAKELINQICGENIDYEKQIEAEERDTENRVNAESGN